MPLFCVFFLKQKPAYEMRIGDWSSDVCSSDLADRDRCGKGRRMVALVGAVDLGDRRRHRPDPAHPGGAGRGPGHSGCDPPAGASGAPPPPRRRSPRKRSEEHTSELQSLMRISYAVFCLKKKKNNYTSSKNLHTKHA